MADTDDQTGNGSGSMRWQGRLVAGLLIASGALHAFKPSWLTLDWPSIMLILVGILLLFVPLDDLGAVIESIEFGGNKIIFQKTNKLRNEVMNAIGSEELKQPAEKVKGDFVGRHRIRDNAETSIAQPEAGNRDQVNESGSQRIETGVSGDYSESSISTLLNTDKEMALIRIAIEIERTIKTLLQQKGVDASVRGHSINRAIAKLVQEEVITAEISRALMQFQRVRNEIVHAVRTVPESAITSVIDSGLELLQFLSLKIQQP